MYEQMSIFDFLPSSYPDINTIPEAEAVRIIGEAIGVRFAPGKFGDWRGKSGRMTLSAKYRHYIDNNRLFVGLGWCLGTSGGGAPCDSIKDAIKWFENVMRGRK